MINFGIVPLSESCRLRCTDSGDRLVIDDIRRQLLAGATRLYARNATRQSAFEVDCDLSQREREIVAAGGLLNYTSKP